MKILVIAMAALLLTAGCARMGQNTYRYDEVGRSSTVSFGTVLAMHEIDIKGKNTGGGAVVGGVIGAGAASYMGQGSGNVWATGAGLLAGLIAGAIAEQAIADRKGAEYTIILESGTTLTIPQETPAGERLIQPGERVMVQNYGSYQRVLPATYLPTEVKRPQGIKVVD